MATLLPWSAPDRDMALRTASSPLAYCRMEHEHCDPGTLIPGLTAAWHQLCHSRLLPARYCPLSGSNLNLVYARPGGTAGYAVDGGSIVCDGACLSTVQG